MVYVHRGEISKHVYVKRGGLSCLKHRYYKRDRPLKHGNRKVHNARSGGYTSNIPPLPLKSQSPALWSPNLERHQPIALLYQQELTDENYDSLSGRWSSNKHGVLLESLTNQIYPIATAQWKHGADEWDVHIVKELLQKANYCMYTSTRGSHCLHRSHCKQTWLIL